MNNTMTIEKVQEISCLLNQKSMLQKELDKIDEEETFAISKSINYNSMDRFYRRLPMGWLDSVYCSRRDVLLRFISSTLSTVDLKRDVYRLKYASGVRKIPYQYYALLCESALSTEEGVVLFLRDPYRRVHTQPIENIDSMKVENWVGRILVVKVRLVDNQETQNCIFVENIKCLKLTRSGEIIYGKEIPVASFLGTEFAFRNKVKGIVPCQIEINRIKKEAQKNGWIVYNNSREDKFYTYFVKNDFMCGIFVKSDIIEIVWKEKMQFSDIDIQCMKSLEMGNYTCHPLENIDKYNVLVRNTDCMCVDPSYDEL